MYLNGLPGGAKRRMHYKPTQPCDQDMGIHSSVTERMYYKTTLDAVRKLMNNFRVDGLSRALTRQLYIPRFLGFSLGLIDFLSFSFVLIFNGEFPISPFWGATRGAKCPI